MSIEPEAPEPRWAVPPVGGWTADDLDTLPNLPPHTELIDGSLVFVSPQTLFHTRAVDFFNWQLQSLAPPELEAVREFTIDVDFQNRPEPDVVVVRADAVESLRQTRFPASSVLLAVEVVSDESVTRDRETKPVKYARARIPHYWRVENQDGRAVVYVFELEPATGAYTSTGIFHDRMKVSTPFPVDLDLTAIVSRRRATDGQDR
ncbi:Uma2 family endonuclease [Streptomyces sp. FT05W]|uniref:Uma2 family endonuclease n=1 Tax=Streptomyces TaxID=1883 RepID=UPI0004C96FE6|nr:MULTISPECIES: Uma2 family endonuclease [Streptomyces]TPN03906.1 Uma2 family endonuclease [Mesorhizobium sp. B2-3-3]MCX4415004.1 Uma2 family endonuclease [[Kitasatospora] papulosa]MCY1653089.1 Uma2 family endonuclease [Streptomyces sp. SL203]MCY1679685.1 Uma2 family endonuclease [Streptomyces sp. SL294]MDX3181471.1 Uma2 family endonuclease [Streptomyces sp. ME02-7008A-1]